MAEAAPTPTVVELDEASVPGALLTDNMAALRMWLLCHGVHAPTSLKKGELINR